jgi:hypothetical protein
MTQQRFTSKNKLKRIKICFELAELRIPLYLSVIFWYFSCRAPTLVDLTNAEDCTLLAIPDGQWDLHSDHHSQNEDDMLDFAGHMIVSSNHQRGLNDGCLCNDHCCQNALIDEACYSQCSNEVNTANVDSGAAPAKSMTA